MPDHNRQANTFQPRHPQHRVPQIPSLQSPALLGQNHSLHPLMLHIHRRRHLRHNHLLPRLLHSLHPLRLHIHRHRRLRHNHLLHHLLHSLCPRRLHIHRRKCLRYNHLPHLSLHSPQVGAAFPRAVQLSYNHQHQADSLQLKRQTPRLQQTLCSHNHRRPAARVIRLLFRRAYPSQARLHPPSITLLSLQAKRHRLQTRIVHL